MPRSVPIAPNRKRALKNEPSYFRLAHSNRSRDRAWRLASVGAVNYSQSAYTPHKGESHMKQTTMLTTSSLLTILFMTFHITSDVLFKMAPPGFSNLFVVFVFAVLLCGTLLLPGRRAGYIIIFFGSLLGLIMPVLHMRGTHGVMGGEIGKSSEAFFFVWTLLALGTTATFSLILSARALLSLPWRRSRRASIAV